ncbi:MAG: hypothetical protein K2V38_01480 [Gemmataceae bacterium]|nr:hypothetical protein [Gemmataceae bacterium]
MARSPKPWFRADRNEYFVTIDGTRHNLGPDQGEADRRFHELMAARTRPAPVCAAGPAVVDVLDKFLGWCQ